MEDEQDPALEPEVTDEKATSPQVEEETAESPEGEGTEPRDGKKADSAEEHELFLDGEEGADDESEPPAPKDGAGWARLRKAEAQAKAEVARLKRELEARSQPAGDAEPGPEPTLEECGYDEDLLKQKHAKYLKDLDRKAEADREKAKRADVERAATQKLMDSYGTKKAEWSARVTAEKYAEAENTVAARLKPDAQDVILKVAKDPAKVVLMLGQRPELLEGLAGETDRDRFVAKLVELEGKIMVKKKGTQAPPPEESVRGSGATGAAGSTLERLRAEAEKTGNYDKVSAFHRKQREKSAK